VEPSRTIQHQAIVTPLLTERMKKKITFESKPHDPKLVFEARPASSCKPSQRRIFSVIGGNPTVSTAQMCVSDIGLELSTRTALAQRVHVFSECNEDREPRLRVPDHQKDGLRWKPARSGGCDSFFLFLRTPRTEFHLTVS
jgi:hypothetical protein